MRLNILYEEISQRPEYSHPRAFKWAIGRDNKLWGKYGIGDNIVPKWVLSAQNENDPSLNHYISLATQDLDETMSQLILVEVELPSEFSASVEDQKTYEFDFAENHPAGTMTPKIAGSEILILNPTKILNMWVKENPYEA
jgi:hypothetical protein